MDVVVNLNHTLLSIAIHAQLHQTRETQTITRSAHARSIAHVSGFQSRLRSLYDLWHYNNIHVISAKYWAPEVAQQGKITNKILMLINKHSEL